MTTRTATRQTFSVGDRVRWKTGKAPKGFDPNETGTVETPPRRMSGETVYVSWQSWGTIPVAAKAIERV